MTEVSKRFYVAEKPRVARIVVIEKSTRDTVTLPGM